MPHHRFLAFAALTSVAAAALAQGGSEAKAVYQQSKDAIVRIDTKGGTGTGFLFRRSDLVVTCYHVVEGEAAIVVRYGDKKAAKPKAIWTDPEADLAILQMESPLGAKPLTAGDFEAAGPGDNVVVIGNPLGFLTQTLTTGVVSAKRLLKGVGLLQISAAVSEGSSGSPVLDSQGKVLGVVSFTFVDGNAANMAVGTPALDRILARAPSLIETFYAAAREEGGSSDGFEDIPLGNAPLDVAGTPAFAQYFNRLWARVLPWEIEWERLSRSANPADPGADKMEARAKKVLQTMPDELGQALMGNRETMSEPLIALMQHIESMNEAVDAVYEAQHDALTTAGDGADRQPKLDAVAEARIKLGKVMQDLYDWAAEQKWFKADEFMAKADPPVAVRAFWPNLLPAYPDPTNLKRAAIGLSLAPELRDGDVITGIRAASSEGWKVVGTWTDLQRKAAEYGSGSRPLELLVDRAGQKYIVRLTVNV